MLRSQIHHFFIFYVFALQPYEIDVIKYYTLNHSNDHMLKSVVLTRESCDGRVLSFRLPIYAFDWKIFPDGFKSKSAVRLVADEDLD